MITIGELSVGTNLTFWVNWQPGIYYYNFDGNYSFIDSSLLVDVPTISGISAIGSVFSNNEQLVEVFNTDDLVNGPSFYYDEVNNGLYIRLANYAPPGGFTINAGPVYGFATEEYIDESTGTTYESRLQNTVDITRKKDPLFFGKITYKDFNVTLDNADGELYDVQNWDVYGQPLSLSVGEQGQSAGSFTPIVAGRVKEYKFTRDQLEITVQDARRILDRKLPINVVLASAHANADRDLGKFIPVVYGSCRGVPCRALDDGATSPSTYSFACADVTDHTAGIKAINTVYVDGVEVAVSSTNLTAGTFVLAAANYKPGQSVTADVDGCVDGSAALIENPLDIVKDILTTYLPVDYNSNYFDLAAWVSARAGKSSIGLCFHKQETIAKGIEAVGATFLEGFSLTPDGKFTWLRHADANAPLFQIKAEDWMDTPEVEFSSDEALSSATVLYDQFFNTGTYKATINDDGYTEFLQKFKLPQDQTFQTLLTSKTDADAMALDLSTRYGDVQILISGDISTHLENAGYIYPLLNLKPGDNIDIEVDGIEIRDGRIVRGDFIGRVKAELLELTISPGSETAQIVARFIESYDTVIVDTGSLGAFVLGADYLSVGGIIDV